MYCGGIQVHWKYVINYEDLEEELPGFHEDLVVLHEQGEEGVVVPVGRQNGRLLCMCVCLLYSTHFEHAERH